MGKEGLKDDFSDEEGRGLRKQPGQKNGEEGSRQEQLLGQRPRSERKLGTFGKLKEILPLGDKSKVSER